MNTTRISKFLSLILRHKPEVAGIALDSEGWADVDALLAGMARKGHRIRPEDLAHIVGTNAKRRYAFNKDRTKIRAVQGHSRPVDLGLPPAVPPATLFHGTVDRFLASIRDRGLVRGTRLHVHLSADRKTAEQVGGRRGRPVILTIDSGAMAREGHVFHLSENGVWLTEHVPASFIIGWE